MPIFADLQLLFIHIPKNAGRSIEKALLQGCSSPDGGRRSIINRAAHSVMRLTRPRFAESHLIGTLDQVLAAQHLTYGEIDLLGLLPTEDHDTNFEVFCVCRNPFDRVVSSICHFSGADDREWPADRAGFERALATWLDRPLTDHNERAHRRPQSDYILDRRGRASVRTILRYESLSDDFARFMRYRGLDNVNLPWRGRSSRSRNYRDYFTPAARKLIESAYEPDLVTFGYRF